MRDVWNQLNHRLLKWEKGLYKYASLRWLRSCYKANPGVRPLEIGTTVTILVSG
jgi:hypothetical protein